MIDLEKEQISYREEVEILLAQAEEKTSEIEILYNEKSNLLSQTRTDKDALARLEKEFETEEADITRMLESYIYGSVPTSKFAWPVAGQLTSGFGYRIHLILGINRFHSGIDLAAPYGTLVGAADGGQVIQAGYSGGYGYSVTLYHGGGFATLYAHLSSIQVTIGQNIERGQVIGLVGSTGLSTGPHLHFEVRINGEPQDPLEYMS